MKSISGINQHNLSNRRCCFPKWMIIRLLLSSRLPVNPVEFRVALRSISPVSRIQSSSRIIFQEIINDPSKERRDFLGKIIRSIKMDCFFLFKERDECAKEEPRRKWAWKWKNPGGETDRPGFVYIRFWTKQIKYRAHSDTGYCITFGCTSWFDLSTSIFIAVFW